MWNLHSHALRRRFWDSLLTDVLPERRAGSVPELLDTGRYQRRRAEELEDPPFASEYRRARAEIAQVDAVMRQLDSLREASGVSKAELARMIGRNPSTVRRRFTAAADPELETIAAIASALGAHIEITSEEPRDGGAPGPGEPRSVA